MIIMKISGCPILLKLQMRVAFNLEEGMRLVFSIIFLFFIIMIFILWSLNTMDGWSEGRVSWWWFGWRGCLVWFYFIYFFLIIFLFLFLKNMLTKSNKKFKYSQQSVSNFLHGVFVLLRRQVEIAQVEGTGIRELNSSPYLKYMINPNLPRTKKNI